MPEQKLTDRPVVGRFAPSPTGPLHFGTILAALGSFLMAKHQDGEWLLRIEDLDQPRVVPGSADEMLRTLEFLGFEWDRGIIFQSRRFGRYDEVLADLAACGHVFDCTCSRREIMASAPHPGEGGLVYPGTCRDGACGSRTETAIRLRVPDRTIVFWDGLYGCQRQNLEKQVGDFVLHRADGQYAYQLAVVVDDIDSGVNQVVRGADLLSSTARQIFLYQCLGQQPPEYFHLPLVLGKDDEKISKRHGRAGLVTRDNGAVMLWKALGFLGQEPPASMIKESPRHILAWGIDNFSPVRIPAIHRQIDFS